MVLIINIVNPNTVHHKHKSGGFVTGHGKGRNKQEPHKCYSLANIANEHIPNVAKIILLSKKEKTVGKTSN